MIVNNSEGNEKLKPAMVEFARSIASRLPAEIPVKLDELPPKKGLVPGSTRLVQGPYGLQSIFTLGSGDVLQLGRKLTAVAGMYKDETGKYSLVLADYPREQAAQKALANVQTNLDPYLKVQEKNDRRLVFKDFNNEFGVVSVAGKRLTIRLHLAKVPPHPTLKAATKNTKEPGIFRISFRAFRGCFSLFAPGEELEKGVDEGFQY